MYPDASEEIPPGSQEPLGKAKQVNVFADAAHADDFITHRSTAGIIKFVNGTPIQWYSKRQSTVESSTYGSDFVAMRIATELTIGLRNDLYTLVFLSMVQLTCSVITRVWFISLLYQQQFKQRSITQSLTTECEKVLQQVSYILQKNQQ